MAATIDIDAAQVVQVMLQFMKENGLASSMKALEEETGVHLNTSTDVTGLKQRILDGRWDAVLKELSELSLPPHKLMSLYEQVVLEMLELRELDTARAMLRSTQPMLLMKRTEPQRYVRLENWLSRGSFDAAAAYEGEGSKESRRAEIAELVLEEVASVPPSRLLSLVGQALKWQQHMGMLKRGVAFDLLRGVTPVKKDRDDRPATKKAGVVRFGAKTHADAAIFTPDGTKLITGTIDGFVEVWNPLTCKIDSDLPYQAKDRFMMHDAGVQCMAVTRDSELLATGAANGKIKVWRLATGKCVRKFLRAHEQGVTTVQFSADCTQVLSASTDATARIHGLRSGRTLKEFRGHDSYVNAAAFIGNGNRIVTASSDGTLKVWDVSSTDCIRTIKLPQKKKGVEVPVLSVMSIPKHDGHLLVCNRTSTLFVINEMGHILKEIAPPTEKEGAFVAALPSRRGKLVYALREDKRLYCFKQESGKLVAVQTVTEADPSTLSHHPLRNIVATLATDSRLILWRASKRR